jgi:hypothetical protein
LLVDFFPPPSTFGIGVSCFGGIASVPPLHPTNLTQIAPTGFASFTKKNPSFTLGFFLLLRTTLGLLTLRLPLISMTLHWTPLLQGLQASQLDLLVVEHRLNLHSLP